MKRAIRQAITAFTPADCRAIVAASILVAMPLCGSEALATTLAAPGPGIGFLWTAQSETVVDRLKSERDFVDVVLGPGKLSVFEKVKPPVRVACIARSLEKNEERPFPGIKETIETLCKAGIAPERVIIVYNPEGQPGTPSQELRDLVANSRKAKQMAHAYGAPLLVGPGLRDMQGREYLYPELAKTCDIWMIQSQRLQLDEATRKPVEAGVYREKVKRIVDKLQEGNSKIRVFAQLVTTAERGTVVLSAEQIAGFVRSIDDLVEAVRIYGAPADLLSQIMERLREPVQAKQTITIPMRGDETLEADRFLPADYSKDKYPQGLPTILIITPYDRSRENAATLWRETMVRNGYAFVAQDMRGMYASRAAGRGAPRHNDGYDTVEWIAKQPWSNGKVGMMGYSHLGAVQYETAVTAPPHLACAIPAQAPGNYYTDSYYPERFRKADMETILRGPLTSRTQQLLNRRVRGRETSNVKPFNTPMLHSAGWFDFYKEGAIEMFRACQRDGGPRARGNQKLLIGPWGHGAIQEENPGVPLRLDGGLAYPANCKLDWENTVWLPWFDHWLKGKQTDVMKQPAVRYYLMGAVDDPRAPGNQWVTADDFPPPSTAVPYYVHSDHSLQTIPPTKESDWLQYVYDPRDPVPTVGRVHARLPVKGPYDQREMEKRLDVLLSSTPPLSGPLEIVGQIRVKLWASSDRKDTDFTAKLTDVYPDGRSMLVLDSIVKGRYRNTYQREEWLTPGQAYEFEIDLGYIAIVLAPGHRLRLALSSSNFDRFDINPNTGEPYGDHAVTRELLAKRLRGYESRGEPQYSATLTAKNIVYMDRQHPTHVILPIVPRGNNSL